VLAKGKKDLSDEELEARFARELTTTLYGELEIEPLYTAETQLEAPGIGLPGLFPFVRGGSLLGGSQEGWDIRQPVLVTSAEPAAANREILEHLERGATSLLLRAEEGSQPLGIDSLKRVLEGVHLELIAISLDRSLGDESAANLLELWDDPALEKASARVVLGRDPLGQLAAGTEDLASAKEQAVAMAKRCVDTFTSARALVVDVTPFHEAGCSEIEELAFATATGVAYLRLLTEAGLDLDQALSQIEFRFVATTDQFLTIAKLRAARLLWARVAQASGAHAPLPQRQHVVTSTAMVSRYDPWVNLLRGTIATFAASVGGADAITVEPYDLLVEPSQRSELGRRMARNTQIILMEESHLAKVIDPAGGSWYVEALTQSVAEESWALFQALEAKGGMEQAFRSGFVAERIEATWTERLGRLRTRKDTITGVSDFPNAAEEIPELLDEQDEGRGGLPQRRYAEPFEALRERVDAFTRRTGERPSVLLVNLGTSSDFSARSTYAKSFFETGGLATDQLEVVGDVSVLASSGATKGVTIACLCSSDDRYEEHGAEVARALKELGVAHVYLAGRRSEKLAELQAAGVEEFIGVGGDVLTLLGDVLEHLGVA
jgi:methylmalonyl-CoA mutase